jgi:hypothetical protein
MCVCVCVCSICNDDDESNLILIQHKAVKVLQLLHYVYILWLQNINEIPYPPPHSPQS